MSRYSSRPAIALFALLSAAHASPAFAQQIKGRVMVLLDTSGSMGYHFNDNNFTGGDGSYSYTDANNNGTFAYPGNAINGACTLATRLTNCDGVNSRLYGAKQALSNAVNAYAGDIDFGLETYDFSFCAFNTPRCATCFGSCGYTQFGINWRSANCSTNGGKILVTPGTGSGASVLPWVDGVEVFLTNAQGQPQNPELRASGSTPLGASINYARTAWYDPIKNAAQGTAAYDAQLNCRPYVLVAETDGVDTCNGDTVGAARALYQDNAVNPVLTYVIGLSINQADQANLNATAAAGGTIAARFANNATDIEAAYADILSRSVKVELCNGQDDNCNAQVDEGYDKGAACTVGAGICQRRGMKKCDPNRNTQTTCCVDDGNPNGPCAPLMPGTGSMEICNGLDDNCNGLVDEGNVCAKPPCVVETCNGKDDDCDGVIDNHLVDVGLSCGFNVGICRPGTTVCQNGMNQDVTRGGVADAADHIVCQGGVQPQVETCNGLDDDCDGVIDGMSQACYSGPMGTAGIGICQGGLQRCVAIVGSGVASWGPCTGEIGPAMEICNGLDDNCNGLVDDVPGANVTCCPSGKCGVGICTNGLMQCSGGVIACVGGQGPQGEVCNGLDDDCNGMTDDLPSLGKACMPMGGGCGGVLTCDVQQMAVICSSQGGVGKEVCNGLDDNCNGLIDEEPDVSMNDARIGVPCGPMGLQAPCSAGKTVCKNGVPTCQGVVLPTAEACNCKDDDCNGLVDDNAYCPTGTKCVACGCYSPCSGGEFPCPGGTTCVDVKASAACDQPGVNPNCYCIPEQTCEPPCGPAEECRPQAPPATHGLCVDRCEGIHCPDNFECRLGVCTSCVDDPTRCKPCDGGAGERCDIATHACVPDLCCGKDCSGGTCQPSTGECRKSCIDVVCTAGQRCVDGYCIDDKCTGKSCQEGALCDPRTGDCVKTICTSGVCSGLRGVVCCGDACVPDPCAGTACPIGRKCTFDVLTCGITCDLPTVPPEDQDRVVGAGGGGLAFGCSVGPTQTGESGASAGGSAIFILALLGLLRARRRRPDA